MHKALFKYLTLGVLVVSSVCLRAQVVFSKKVQPLELVPRNISNNLGTVTFSGQFFGNKYNSMRVLMFQNNVKKIDYVQGFTGSAGTTSFSYSTQIKAGKYNYDFVVYFYGNDTFTYRADRVVCGDVFIIQGQSNAVANSYYGLANPRYNDSFIRSFGTSNYDYTTCQNDTNWHLADGDGYYAPGCTGQWGLVLARYVLDSMGMPVAIFNGAVGGTSVVYHQKYTPQPDNLYTIYGRLLYRIKKAGLQNNIRSLFYFQGESDGIYPRLHDSLFRILFSDWKQDYKSIKKYYVVQVRGGGCGNPAGEILEVQRQFEFTLANCKVVTSNGLNGHDGCHYYFKDGYEQLGKILSPLVARDLYGKTGLSNIDPPNIKSAEFANADFTKIALNMMQPFDSIFADPNFHTLFSVSGDSTVYIVSGSVVKNRVVLTLNKGTCKPLKISYVGKPFAQPWVKNRIGSALISFNQVPVDKPKPNEWYTVCSNTKIKIGGDSIEGYKYQWKKTTGNTIYKTAKIEIKTTQNEAYQLVLSNNMSSCKYDTFQVNVTVDPTPHFELGRDTVLCKNQFLNFDAGNVYVQPQWKFNDRVVSASVFKADTAGKLIFSAYSNVGCTFADTLQIGYSKPTVKIKVPKFTCDNVPVKALAKGGFTQYRWNNYNGTDTFFVTPAGLITLEVKDQYACYAFDTTSVQAYPAMKYTPPKVEFCKGDSVKIVLPEKFAAWKNNNVQLPNAYFFNEYSPKQFTLIDSNFCTYFDSVEAKVNPRPFFNLGKDTAVCMGNSVKITCPLFAQKYYWNGSPQYNNYFETTTAAKVTCKIINAYNCSYTDTLTVSQHPQPVLALPADTILCENEILEWVSDTNYQYALNGTFYTRVTIRNEGSYTLTIKNKTGCTESADIRVTYKQCVNALKTRFAHSIEVYPNPVDAVLYFKGNELGNIIKTELYGYNGQLILKKGYVDSLDFSQLGAGIYYLRLTGTNTNRLFKIIKK